MNNDANDNNYIENYRVNSYISHHIIEQVMYKINSPLIDRKKLERKIALKLHSILFDPVNGTIRHLKRLVQQEIEIWEA